jgi:hypothetical protein
MTPEEQQMLNDLANRIAQTPAPARDPEAEDFIRTHIGSRPDALYLMTQTVLIQNLALEHAKQQIDQLQRAQQPASAAPAASFIGGPQAAPAPAQSWGPAPPAQSGGHSFLRSAATTAAGVAAGALAFEGIRSMLGGGPNLFGGGGWGGGVPGGSFLGNAPGETIVNNYYDSPEGRDRDDRNDSEDRNDPDERDSDASGDNADDSDDSGTDGGGSDSGGDTGDGGGGDWA